MTDPVSLLATGPGTLIIDMRLLNTATGDLHPHRMDVFIPSQDAIGFSGQVPYFTVMLHGGGGNKKNFERTSRIVIGKVLTPKTVNWDLVNGALSVFVFVQGEYCRGNVNENNPYGVNTVSAKQPNGVPNWSNRVFYSGADDMQLLRDLSGWAASAFPTAKRYLVGHSSGGMMTQRVWYDEPTLFERYWSYAGPAAIDYDPVLGTRGLPTVKRPLYETYGWMDPNMGPGRDPAHPTAPLDPEWLYDQQYTAPPQNFSIASVFYRPGVPPSATPIVYSGAWGRYKRLVTALGYDEPVRGQTWVIPRTHEPGTGAKLGTQLRVGHGDPDDAPWPAGCGLYLYTAGGHAWGTNRRKPEGAPGLQQCAGRLFCRSRIAFP